MFSPEKLKRIEFLATDSLRLIEGWGLFLSFWKMRVEMAALFILSKRVTMEILVLYFLSCCCIFFSLRSCIFISVRSKRVSAKIPRSLVLFHKKNDESGS